MTVKKPKGLAAIILAGGKPEEADAEGDDLESAAAELLEAVAQKDAAAVAAALRNAFTILEAEPHEEGEEIE